MDLTLAGYLRQRRNTALPNDIELVIAQQLLDQAMVYEKLQEALLALPRRIVIGEQIEEFGSIANTYRAAAAAVLRVDPVVLEP